MRKGETEKDIGGRGGEKGRRQRGREIGGRVSVVCVVFVVLCCVVSVVV